MPLTTYVAFIAGGFGEECQEAEFDENTVLGIKAYHWIWAIVPIYWYARGIVFVAAKFIAFQVATWGETGIFISIISLLLLLPILVWGIGGGNTQLGFQQVEESQRTYSHITQRVGYGLWGTRRGSCHRVWVD